METAILDSTAAKKLGDLIKDIRFAMLTTQTPEGSLRSRPMATQEGPFNGELWFFTADDSPKTDEIAQEHQVNVSYADASSQRYVSISGAASLVRDKDKARELWKPVYKAWFPGGLDDPHLALLRIRVEQAEYWDAPSSKMVHLYGLAKAALSGKPVTSAGDHGKFEAPGGRVIR